MNCLFRACDTSNCGYRARSNAMLYKFGKLRRHADHRGGPHQVTLKSKHNAKFSLADAHGVRQHGFEYGLQPARKMLSSLKDWVDAAHFYRHEPGTEDVAQPPLPLALYLVSTGASHLRWLGELGDANRHKVTI